jgi:Protein of unknown function (DUF3180)
VTEPHPHLTPTRPGTLVVAAALAGLVGWLLVSRYYGEVLPRLTFFPSVTLVGLAVGEGVTARITRSRIERRPGTEPVEPLVVARLAALAKASSLAGAMLGGGYLGILLWAFVERDWLAAAEDAIPAAAAGTITSALLVGAGLWLEHACRIPKRPDDNADASPGAGQ